MQTRRRTRRRSHCCSRAPCAAPGRPTASRPPSRGGNASNATRPTRRVVRQRASASQNMSVSTAAWPVTSSGLFCDAKCGSAFRSGRLGRARELRERQVCRARRLGEQRARPAGLQRRGHAVVAQPACTWREQHRGLEHRDRDPPRGRRRGHGATRRAAPCCRRARRCARRSTAAPPRSAPLARRSATGLRAAQQRVQPAPDTLHVAHRLDVAG